MTTRRGHGWGYLLQVWGFREWKEALQFEWALKREVRRTRNIVAALARLVHRPRWTSRAPLASLRPIAIDVVDPQAWEALRADIGRIQWQRNVLWNTVTP